MSSPSSIDDGYALLAMLPGMANVDPPALRWVNGTDPCNETQPWTGVHCGHPCSNQPRVKGVSLVNIPVSSEIHLQHIPGSPCGVYLTTITVKGCGLTGSVDLSEIPGLDGSRYLYIDLSNNTLSGSINFGAMPQNSMPVSLDE